METNFTSWRKFELNFNKSNFPHQSPGGIACIYIHKFEFSCRVKQINNHFFCIDVLLRKCVKKKSDFCFFFLIMTCLCLNHG